MRTVQRLRINVGSGVVLRINYITEINGNLRLLSTEQTRFPTTLNYAKVVEGAIRKRSDKDFAFLKTDEGDYYIAPNLIKKYNLQDKESVKSLIVYDYNKKNEDWNWVCISINKKIN